MRKPEMFLSPLDALARSLTDVFDPDSPWEERMAGLPLKPLQSMCSKPGTQLVQNLKESHKNL